MNKILISIVIPIYNVEKYIKDFLMSFNNQKTEDIEFVFVNDGSTDNSMSILMKNLELFKHYKIVNKENGGLSSARNEGLKVCCGEYVSFLDSDDKVEECFLDVLRNNTGYDLSMFDYTRFNDLEKRYTLLIQENIYLKEDIFQQFIPSLYGIESLPMTYTIFPTVWGKLYKLSIIQKNNILFLSEREYSSEDSLFNIEYLSKCYSVNYIKKSIVLYRVNYNSLTMKEKNTEFYDSRIRLLKKYKECSKMYENKISYRYKQKLIFECIQWFQFSFFNKNNYFKNKKQFKKRFVSSFLETECENVLINLSDLKSSNFYKLYFWMIMHRMYFLCFLIQKVKYIKERRKI